MNLFWSDTHFNHEGILGHANRPYKDVFEMNEALVEKWNSKVGVGDSIYLLGDFGFHSVSSMPLDVIFNSLHGVKYLVRGNHDYKNKAVLKLPWREQFDLKEVKDNHRKATTCHYPLETWASCWNGTMMLHGHCHGTLKRTLPKRFDVGADVEVAGPVSFDELWERAILEPFEPTDGHTGRDM